jgi:stearoyl-CoA desaturase (Delta-9 desaturase)
MKVLWIPLVFVTAFHIAAVIGAYYVAITRTGVAALATMWIMTGLGITVGYHRLWSHRAYKGILAWRIFWAIWGAGALQGSILWWSKLHRLHHSFPDTPADPYGNQYLRRCFNVLKRYLAPVKGFLHSHCLWMFQKVDRSKDLALINVNDLKEV